MLPRNRLGRAQLTKLKVYAGPDHPHHGSTAEATGDQDLSDDPTQDEGASPEEDAPVEEPAAPEEACSAESPRSRPLRPMRLPRRSP